MNVVVIKLSSGEEIIARTVSQNSLLVEKNDAPSEYDQAGPWALPTKDLTLEDIRIITIQQVAPGQVGIGFVPWAVGNPDGKITIRANTVAAIYPARKELEDGYLGQTSGLAIAGAGALPPSTRM